MRTLLFAAAVVAATSSPLKAGDPSPWVRDYDKAVALAKAEGKHLLVDFTGSDWCHWCHRLDGEVFSKEEFLTAAKKHFVLVLLDFPNGEEAKAQVPNPQRNQELAEKHGVQGFPSVLLMTSEGKVFARTGYRPGGAEPYVAFLDTLRTGYEGVVALVTQYGAAAAEAKPALLDKAVATMQGFTEESAGGGDLAVVVKDALAEGQAPELQERAVDALCAAGQGDASVHAAAKRLDPKNGKGLLEKAVLGYMATVNSLETCRACFAAIEELDGAGAIRDDDRARTIYLNATFWNHRFLQDPAAARKYALKLKALGGGDAQVDGLVSEVLGDDDPAVGAEEEEDEGAEDGGR